MFRKKSRKEKYKFFLSGVLSEIIEVCPCYSLLLPVYYLLSKRSIS